MNKNGIIVQNTSEHIKMMQDLTNDLHLNQTISDIANLLIKCYKHDGKTLFCGNGGSAADAQHISAELQGRYKINREPLYAEALHVNTSYLTAVANDFGYQEVFARAIRAQGKNGDVLCAFSTSGNSENIILALKDARLKNMKTVGFTGANPSSIFESYCDLIIKVPSNNTPRIQEAHILLGHIICEIVEKALFSE